MCLCLIFNNCCNYYMCINKININLFFNLKKIKDFKLKKKNK